ncbi:hypothetical protein HKD37_20G055799 [Glycine soja]
MGVCFQTFNRGVCFSMDAARRTGDIAATLVPPLKMARCIPHTFSDSSLSPSRCHFLPPSFTIEAPHKAPTFGAHFYSKSRKEGIFGVVKCVATSRTSKIQLVLCECCFAWMLWKLGRIDGDPVLRETRIWATWEYVSSVGGGQQGMVGLCAHCGCGKTCCAPSPDRHLVPHVMEWYLEICRGGQETLGTSGGVLLPKTKLDQSRPNPGIVGQLENEVRKLRKPLIVMAAQLIRDRVEMECLEGAWETLEGNTRCRFRGTIRFTATSLVHPDEPARTLQHTVEWTAPWISFVYF